MHKFSESSVLIDATRWFVKAHYVEVEKNRNNFSATLSVLFLTAFIIHHLGKNFSPVKKAFPQNFELAPCLFSTFCMTINTAGYPTIHSVKMEESLAAFKQNGQNAEAQFWTLL